MITLAKAGLGGHYGTAAETASVHSFNALSATGLLDIVHAYNDKMLAHADHPLSDRGSPEWMDGANYLLPMAFVEGSPMHPSYGAGHATVAGACVTVLKAFFNTVKPDGTDVTLSEAGITEVYQPDSDGKKLMPSGDNARDLTLSSELEKLAANISIGRNMAGVHYYSDYFDSLRMGERVAIGILHEQMLTYGEPFTMRLRSFDGDLLTLAAVHNGHSAGGVSAELSVEGDIPELWWRRHIPVARFA